MLARPRGNASVLTAALASVKPFCTNVSSPAGSPPSVAQLVPFYTTDESPNSKIRLVWG